MFERTADISADSVERSSGWRSLAGLSLGEILAAAQGITHRSIEEALAAQADGSEQGRLGEILVRRGVTHEEQVLKALALQFDLPYQPAIDVEEVDPTLLGSAGLPLNYARANRLLPIKRLPDGMVRIAVADPTLTSTMDEVRVLLGAPLAPFIVTSQVVIDAIHLAYDRAISLAEIEQTFTTAHAHSGAGEGTPGIESGVMDGDEDAPIIRLVNTLLMGAVKARVSDVHIEPFEKTLIVRYRVDGVLKRILEPPKRLHRAIVSRIKVMAGLNVAENRLPQDGHVRITHLGKEIDVRLSTAPTVNGERVVMRLLDKGTTRLTLEDVGFDDAQLGIMQSLIDRPHGLILVTGPTGSGKTTTLYAALSRINNPDLNIMTIEDPVEYQLHGIAQMQVNPKIDLSFASGLRCFLRQDPDIIMVGEIRDSETAEIAIQAGLAGHLVFSTLHTNDAPGAVTRLTDIGVEPFLIASSLVATIAQRLARRVCRSCRVPHHITRKALLHAQVPEGRIDRYIDGHYFRASAGGCTKCEGSGYSGRTGIYEFLLMDDDVRALIVRKADSNTIKRAAMRSQSMVLLREDGVKRASQGLTTLEEVLRVTEEAFA